MRGLRGYFVDEAGKRANLKLSAILFQKVLGLRMEARPQSIGSFSKNLQEFESIRDFITSFSITALIDIPFVALALLVVWYLGGNIAEQGVSRSAGEQILAARSALAEILAWLDFTGCSWATLKINRAEPEMSDGSRPVEPFVSELDGIITAWPVKLAMTPLMTDRIVTLLEKSKLRTSINPFNHVLQKAGCDLLPWQKAARWEKI